MSYITDHKQKFEDLQFQIRNLDQLKKKANGGNSIVFSYPPEEEQLYVTKARELFLENAAFIDISKLFVKLIDEDGWESFKKYYLEFKDTPHVVFRSDDPGSNLFDKIIEEVRAACKSNKLPFLVRTGCLHGTGIENVNIMENRSVMNLSHPLVIFYPSRIEDDNLFFLNFKPASKYRCTLVR